MSGIADSALADLLKTTLANLPWDGKFTALMKYRSYPALNLFLRKKHVLESGGTTLDWRVQYKDSGAAAFVKINEAISPSVVNTMVNATVPWRHANTHWTVNRQELMQNRGRSKLISLVQTRRLAGMASLANALEEAFWTQIPLTTNDRTIYPVDYFLPKIGTAGDAAGFNGENPTDAAGSSFASCCGIDASAAAYSRWKSWNGSWSAGATATNPTITDADLAVIRKMYRQIHFEAPGIVDMPNEPARSLRFYTNDQMIGALETTADARNDNLGFDVAKVAGIISIKGVPVVYVGKLDSDTTHPLYGINHSVFQTCVLKGDYFREHDPMSDVTQPNTLTTHMDLTFQNKVDDRRRAGGVINRPA